MFYLASGMAMGQLFDFTLRIGLPQLERDRVSSTIKTTNAAVTRAADVMAEPAATNKIRNNTMVGAVNGTPGTMPTNWLFVDRNGLSHTVVGAGAEGGIEYIDLRVFGTTTSAGANTSILQTDTSTGPTGTDGQSLFASMYVRLVGGSMANASLSQAIVERDSTGTFLIGSNAAFTPSTSALSEQRPSVSRTFTSAGAAYATQEVWATWGSSVAVDFTLRIGLPQLELDRVSSPIRTSGSAVTRPEPSPKYGLMWSNLTENDTDDGPAWVSAQAVAKDEYRRRPNHKVYKALQAAPTSVTAAPETNPKDGNGNPYWLEWDPTNRWAALDTTLDTASAGPDVLQWVVRPGDIANAVAVLGMDAQYVSVSMVTGAGIVMYRQTKALLLKTSRSWSDWLFKTRERRSDEVFYDIPHLKTGIYCITVTKPGGSPVASDIKMGRLEDIGETLIKPEIRTLRRSTIKDDGYGRYRFTKRPSSKIMSANVYIDASRFDAVGRMLDKYADEPCVIIGDSRWTRLILLGYADDYSLVLDDGNNANYNLKAIGLG
jgi:hypothetical protein